MCQNLQNLVDIVLGCLELWLWLTLLLCEASVVVLVKTSCPPNESKLSTLSLQSATVTVRLWAIAISLSCMFMLSKTVIFGCFWMYSGQQLLNFSMMLRISAKNDMIIITMITVGERKCSAFKNVGPAPKFGHFGDFQNNFRPKWKFSPVFLK